MSTHSVESQRYTQISQRLKAKADQESLFGDIGDIIYLPFSRNTSPSTRQELRAIRAAQDSPPLWYEPQYSKRLDEDFVDVFIEAATEYGLEVSREELVEIVERTDPLIAKLKIFYGRPRPYELNDYHDIDIRRDDSETAQTPSYPSGHALQASAIAAYLENLYPGHGSRFRTIAGHVAHDRVLRGVHFPSDNEFSNLIVDKYITPTFKQKVYISKTNSSAAMKKVPYNYTATFESSVQASCADGCCQRWGISEASLENLKPLIPEDVDLTKNIDLLGVAFNAAVVNQFNKNGDGINTETALTIKDYFLNKPTNIEHNKEKVVGHIISAAFSDHKTNELLLDSQVKDTEDPFNIALGALVYKVVNPAFANLLEQTAEGEEYHNVISASWEIGFNEYYIALGSRDLNEAEIIKDKKEIKELTKYLKAYDGDGELDDGTPVNRLVVGTIYPLGIGFTANPAAAVEGVIIESPRSPSKKETSDAEGEKDCSCEKIELEKNKKNSSLLEKDAVNMENALHMDTKDLLKEIEGMLADKVADSKHVDEAVASVSKVMMDAIRTKDEEWQEEKAAQESLLAEATKAQESLSTQLDEVKAQLGETQSQLDSLAEEKQLREAKDRFNQRMAAVTEAFDLDDADLKIVAAEISELDTADEAFSDYQEKLNVMWAHKTKAYLETQEKKFQEELEKAVEARLQDLTETVASEVESSQDEDVEELLENVDEETTAAVLNNNEEAAAPEISLREKFSQAFSKENISVKY